MDTAAAPPIAASTVFIVWLTIALVTTAAVAAVLAGLVLHVLRLGRTLRRFQDDVTAVAEQITDEADRTAARTARLSASRPRASGRSPRSR